MAFPATYNISYYRGDTYTFVINPKNANGTAFNLNGYTGLFLIATQKGNAEAFVDYGNISLNASAANITCEIPESLYNILSGASYVYDIEIQNDSASTTYTLLTGTISVSSDVVEGA